MRLDLCGHLKAEATVSARGHAKGASETSEGCVSIWDAEMVEYLGCGNGGGNWEEKVIRGVLVCAGVSSKRGVRDTRCRYKLAEGLRMRRSFWGVEQILNLRGRDGLFLVGLCLWAPFIGLCGLWLLLLWLVQRLFVWWLEWPHGHSVERPLCVLWYVLCFGLCCVLCGAGLGTLLGCLGSCCWRCCWSSAVVAGGAPDLSF